MSYLKKIQCVILSIVIIILSLFAGTTVLSGKTRLNRFMCEREEYESIKSSRSETFWPLETSISANDYGIIYDRTGKTYYYSAIESSSEPYNPYLSFSKEDSGIKIAFEKTDIDDELIKKGAGIPMLVYNDSEYTEATFVITTLPIISISLPETTNNSDDPISENYIKANFSLFDNRTAANHVNRIITSNAKIRLRGATTKGFDKKSYRISLQTESLGGNTRGNDVSLLGMRADDDWILYPGFNDPEKVRNSLSMQVWMAFGAKNNDYGMVSGCESKMTEVFINGRYWGIYSLMYPVDEKQFAISDTPKTDGSYEYWWRTVGYKVPTTEQFQKATADSITSVEKFQLRSPLDVTGLGYKRWAVIDRFNESLTTEDDDEFVNSIFKIADTQNEIDMWLWLKMTQACDNCGKNTNYVAKYRNGKYTVFLSPWDCDQTWGLVWHTGVFTNTDILIDPTDPINNYDFYMVITRCVEMGMSKIITQVKERYKEIRSTVLTNKTFYNWLNEYEDEVYGSGAAVRDATRWPRSKTAENMDDLRHRVMTHMDWMDEYIATLDTQAVINN